MISQLILEKIDTLRSGGSIAPLLVTEAETCEVLTLLFHETIDSIDTLESRGITDFLYYDCADRSHKWAEHYRVKILREHVEKLYQKPSGDILVALFHNLEALHASWEQKAENALLHLFEDVPPQLLILATSNAPQKIIPTLRSRMVLLAPGILSGGINPHQDAINAYISGDPEPLFSLTLPSSKESKFSREDALWIVQGLQDALECGRLSPRYARHISDTRVYLETTNTIAKYLIDQLLITLSCE